MRSLRGFGAGDHPGTRVPVFQMGFDSSNPSLVAGIAGRGPGIGGSHRGRPRGAVGAAFGPRLTAGDSRRRRVLAGMAGAVCRGSPGCLENGLCCLLNRAHDGAVNRCQFVG
jgi:hypothetical protein